MTEKEIKNRKSFLLSQVEVLKLKERIEKLESQKQG